MQEEIKKDLITEFGTEVTIQGKKVKTSVTRIDGNTLVGLKDIYFLEGVKDIEIVSVRHIIEITVTLN